MISLKKLVVFATALFSAAMPARGDVLGISFDGTLVNVNPSTGATSNPRSTGLNQTVGIAFSPTGTLYTITAFGAATNPNSLFTLNPVTGAATLVGPTTGANLAEGDLAFSPGGKLYALSSFLPAQMSRQLVTINPATGAAVIVGTVNSGDSAPDFSAIAFTPTGTMYVFENTTNGLVPGTGGNLLTINPTNAATINSVALSQNLGGVEGMYYDSITGNLIVADGSTGAADELFSLNPTTGVLSPIGSVTAAAPNGVSGLAVTPAPLPPAVFAALPGLLLAGFFLRRIKTA